MLSVMPVAVMATALMFIALAKIAARGQKAYLEATTIVEQTVGSIRTVSDIFFLELWYL